MTDVHIQVDDLGCRGMYGPAEEFEKSIGVLPCDEDNERLAAKPGSGETQQPGTFFVYFANSSGAVELEKGNQRSVVTPSLVMTGLSFCCLRLRRLLVGSFKLMCRLPGEPRCSLHVYFGRSRGSRSIRTITTPSIL